MIEKIIAGTLEVLGGTLSKIMELVGNSDKIFAELNTKLMGSYDDIEKLNSEKK